MGADVVLHSGTKYLGGHSDVLLGVVTCSSETSMGRILAPKLRMVQSNIGAVASPFDSWLTLRGLRTLQVRLERQCSNAMALALFLEQTRLQQAQQYLERQNNENDNNNNHESDDDFLRVVITKVHYPGLQSHPQHEIAKKQMMNHRYGGMLSFEVGSPYPATETNSKNKMTDEDMAMAIAGAVKVIKRATSLGGTETLIEHRASIEPEGRVVSPPGLLRLSVGLEDINDLITDVENALKIANAAINQLEKNGRQ